MNYSIDWDGPGERDWEEPKARIPLLCLGCGNAILSDRNSFERDAVAVAHSACAICDRGDNKGFEEFYIDRSGELVDFGTWSDRQAAIRAAALTKATS